VIAAEGRNVEVAEANSRARETLDDGDEQARLTRGKDLLASVRRRVQETFGISFGNQALLSEITVDELDHELVEFLRLVEGLALE
jgi:hypothetical protein